MSVKKHIPNSITCCNLISGCIATYFAFEGKFDLALLFIIIGAVFDFFDGMSARLLGVSSPIGKELDSLADDITFGFAPSAILFSYLCTLHIHLTIAPFLAFIMAAFSALRLAKFNLDERQALGFIGLPTPANALFWGSLAVGQHAFLVSLKFNAVFLFFFMLLFCLLLVAEIPLFALKFKNLSWAHNRVKYVFLAGAAVILLTALLQAGSSDDLLPSAATALSAIIVWYILLALVANSRRSH